MESPDSNRPVFWIITTGFLPPTQRPAAMPRLSPSRQMATMSMDSSAAICSYMKLVSLSGSHTT